MGKVLFKFAALLGTIFALLYFLAEPPVSQVVKEGKDKPLAFESGMTIARFGEVNGLSGELLDKAFKLKEKEERANTLEHSGLSNGIIAKRVEGLKVLEREEASKNWVKIALKVGLWVLLMPVAFLVLKRGAMTPKRRFLFYAFAVLSFGVLLGPEPSPMATLKDNVVLLLTKGVFFPPRMVVMTGLLAIGLVASKFICSWGCQFGTLQDLIFRMNRNREDTEAATVQFKLPFALTNTLRASVFAAMFFSAAILGADMIGAVDPFKIYFPPALTAGMIALLALLLPASLFVYRPWCHLACPFGLLTWALEKVSFFRIRVERATCTSCGACARACPSDAMAAKLKDKGVRPDCFSCGTCINVCPTGSISLGRYK